MHPYAWGRLYLYAALVEELDTIHGEYHLDPCIWHVLRRLARGGPLLPNLRNLQWRITSTQCTALAQLLSPSLRELVLQCSTSPGPLSPMEQLEWGFALWMPLALTLPIPRLTHISLSYSGFHSPAVLYPISKLASLQSFRLCVDRGIDTYGAPILISDLFLFLDTERLEHLDVDCELSSLTDSHSKRHLRNFTALRSLSIPHCPGNDAWYSRFSSRALTRLTIHRYLADTLADFHTTCAIWARHFPSLRSFSCSLAPPLGAPVRLADAIAPLFRLRNVREFKLTFALNTQLVVLNADLIDVAQSWPHLTSLALVASSTSRDPSLDAEGPGFAALEAFRLRCPALERLWIPHLVLHARDVPFPAGKPAARAREGEGEGEREHGLREVVVRWIDADDYRLAAALLDRLFPCLGVENRAVLWGDTLREEDEDGV